MTCRRCLAGDEVEVEVEVEVDEAAGAHIAQIAAYMCLVPFFLSISIAHDVVALVISDQVEVEVERLRAGDARVRPPFARVPALLSPELCG